MKLPFFFNHPKENPQKGVLYALIGFFFMALFGIFLKAAKHGASPLWTNFIAYLTASCILLIPLCKEGVSVLKTKHFGLHFLRALFGVAAVLAYIYSVHYIPLLNATLLFNATPLPRRRTVMVLLSFSIVAAPFLKVNDAPLSHNVAKAKIGVRTSVTTKVKRANT